MSLFSRKKPEEVVREWDKTLNREQRKIDREIQQSKREVTKLENECKVLAKKNQLPAAKVVAKQVIQGRKCQDRMHATKANINSVQLNMKQQMAMAKVGGALQKSTEVMKSMQRLVRVPEIMMTMRDLQKEMTKSGIIGETMDELLEDALDDGEDMEEDTDEEINKVLSELITGKLTKVATGSLPVEPAASVEQESDEDDDKLQERLAGLRS